MKLSIIIPAYNEEEAIGAIIERTLRAKEGIIKNTDVKSIEVIVVNDGSKDRTKQIAEGYKGIILISYDINRGYGGAIKQGFEKASGDLLSFLDADGTCDPLLFVDLVNSLIKNGADIAIGSRLGPGNRMPKIRLIGNKIYAGLINFFGNSQITDCSSGMRVLRRPSLEVLYPLPNGLHFTPAMTCKAIMGRRLKIVETPIEYSERTGVSKLNVVTDGLKFLKIILGSAARYRPFKFFATLLFTAWVILWISFATRELFFKDNLRDYGTLMHRSLEGKRSYLTGDRFYEFVKFCADNLPDGADYMWSAGDKQDHARRRATYYLYPHLEADNARFLLVYDDPNANKSGYKIFCRLDDRRYILVGKER